MVLKSLGTLLGAGLLLTAVSVSAQETPVVSPLNLSRVMGNTYYPAPDGHRLLYVTRNPDPGLMLVDASGASEPVFIPLPQENGEWLSLGGSSGTFLNRVSWSPDGTRFVVSGADYYSIKEGDLWLYTLETSEWINLTEDAFSPRALGNIMLGGEQTETPLGLESQPVWSPDGQQIAFERYHGLMVDPYQTTISVVDLATQEIRDLAVVPFKTEQSSTLASVASLAWSPDGTALYTAILTNDLDPAINGLYRLDVVTGELNQLMTYAEIRERYTEATGITDSHWVPTAPFSLSPDGQQLLLWVGETDDPSIPYWPFVYDIAGDELSPLVSFQDWENPAGSGLTPFLPLHAAWSPDSQSVLLAARVPENQDDLPVLVDAPPADLMLARVEVAAAAFEPLGLVSWMRLGPVSGVWNTNGQVLLGGYHLQLLSE